MTPSVRAPNGKLVVVLSAAPNPDYEERMWEGSVSIPPQRRVVSDLREASRAVREFIGANDLGGGNWTGGQVYDDAGRQVAHISYNGRAWEPGRWPTPEIKLAASRVAARRIASEADALLDQLADLATLDGALTDIEESFASHYGRVASTIRPEVVSHHDALSKSIKGLEQANNILKSAEAIVAAFPEDKTAKRAVADASTMVAQFTRHVEEGRKILRTLAQKQMPPALKAAAAKVKAALESALRRAPSSRDTDPVEVQGLNVSGAYRSGLPKDGAYAVGEYEYERMVKAEIADWRRILDPLLAPHMAGIASVRVGGGEKSWIYTDIFLK